MKPSTKQDEKQSDAPPAQFDDVLRRMLSTPPRPHKKPAAKPAQKKPAK